MQPWGDTRTAAFERRRERLARKVEAILVTDPDNLLWLTGTWEPKPESWLLYAGELWHTIPGAHRRKNESKTETTTGLDQLLLRTIVADICHAAGSPSPLLVDRGRQWANPRTTEATYPLTDGRQLICDLRQYKDADEIEIMVRNAGLVRDVLDSAGQRLRPGMSELEIWSSVLSGLRHNEPESLQVYGNCASGPRTLEPDPHASSRIIQAGEPLLLDVYPRIDGYFADLSRTWCCGTVTSQMGRMIDAVRETLDATAAMITPGIRGIEVDHEARAMLTRRGYPDAYAHHTGHGLGVKQQERPWLRPRSADVIRDGMIIALEPACYVDGVGGVRLEDEFLVTAKGARSLTALARSDPPSTAASPHGELSRPGEHPE